MLNKILHLCRQNEKIKVEFIQGRSAVSNLRVRSRTEHLDRLRPRAPVVQLELQPCSCGHTSKSPGDHWLKSNTHYQRNLRRHWEMSVLNKKTLEDIGDVRFQ